MWHVRCWFWYRPNRMYLFSLRWLWSRSTFILNPWVSNPLVKWRQAHQWSFGWMFREVGARCVNVFLYSCFGIKASSYVFHTFCCTHLLIHIYIIIPALEFFDCLMLLLSLDKKKSNRLIGSFICSNLARFEISQRESLTASSSRDNQGMIVRHFVTLWSLFSVIVVPTTKEQRHWELLIFATSQCPVLNSDLTTVKQTLASSSLGPD